MIELGSRAGIGLKPNIQIAQQAVEPSDSLDQVNLGFFQSIGIQKGQNPSFPTSGCSAVDSPPGS